MTVQAATKMRVSGLFNLWRKRILNFRDRLEANVGMNKTEVLIQAKRLGRQTSHNDCQDAPLKKSGAPLFMRHCASGPESRQNISERRESEIGVVPTRRDPAASL
jgi:hypothetical protein